MAIQPPKDMVGRESEWDRLTDFANSGEASASLGIVWGRRRIGKSFLLQDLSEQMRGFYYHALRGSSAEALRDLGEDAAPFVHVRAYRVRITAGYRRAGELFRCRGDVGGVVASQLIQLRPVASVRPG